VKNGMSDIKATPEIEKAIRGLYVKGKGFLPMSVCGYCRDCKWWKVYSMWRICELMEGDPEGEQVHPESKAKGDNVEIEPDFGCVQFEAKESEG
jgi:hypothetical protein